MRIWDIHPGYLNRQSLLGEHRELHAVVSIIRNHKRGYANHPETLRWTERGWALTQRHRLLAAEMELRGYRDRSPVNLRRNPDHWPDRYIDAPWDQYRILKEKYKNREPGRIPLPDNAQQLWRQHKYSVMARDPQLTKALGRELSDRITGRDIGDLAQLLTALLRKQPSPGGIRNALQHMWGYVSASARGQKRAVGKWGNSRLLEEIQHLAAETGQSFLISSTALSELKVWLRQQR